MRFEIPEFYMVKRQTLINAIAFDPSAAKLEKPRKKVQEPEEEKEQRAQDQPKG